MEEEELLFQLEVLLKNPNGLVPDISAAWILKNAIDCTMADAIRKIQKLQNKGKKQND